MTEANKGSEVLRLARKFHEELSGEDLATHAAVAQTMNILLQHRATVEQHQAQEKAQRDHLAASLAIDKPRLV